MDEKTKVRIELEGNIKEANESSKTSPEQFQVPFVLDSKSKVEDSIEITLDLEGREPKLVFYPDM